MFLKKKFHSFVNLQQLSVNSRLEIFFVSEFLLGSRKVSSHLRGNFGI